MENKRQRQFPTTMSTTSFVKLYILHLLTEGHFYGNEIKDEIKTRLQNRWEPSPGMIYPLLRQLESEGYIEGWWEEPDRRSIKTYKITDEGLRHYKVLLLQNKASLDDSLIIIKSILKDIYNEYI